MLRSQNIAVALLALGLLPQCSQLVGRSPKFDVSMNGTTVSSSDFGLVIEAVGTREPFSFVVYEERFILLGHDGEVLEENARWGGRARVIDCESGGITISEIYQGLVGFAPLPGMRLEGEILIGAIGANDDASENKILIRFDFITDDSMEK